MSCQGVASFRKKRKEKRKHAGNENLGFEIDSWPFQLTFFFSNLLQSTFIVAALIYQCTRSTVLSDAPKRWRDVLVRIGQYWVLCSQATPLMSDKHVNVFTKGGFIYLLRKRLSRHRVYWVLEFLFTYVRMQDAGRALVCYIRFIHNPGRLMYNGFFYPKLWCY